MKDILAIVYSEFNALFKEKFLNNEANYTFPDSRRDPDGKKTIASRKEAAENLGEEIIKQSKALRPYAPLQNLVKKYFNDQLAGVYDTGGSFLSKFVEKTTFFENMFGANYPQDITTSMISMMLITNVASIGGLTLIKCASKPQDLPPIWFKAIEKPLPEFTDIHKKYLAAHRTLIRVDETFNYNIPAMPSIQKRSKTDIKDFVIPIPIEYTSDKSVEEWISLHKAAKFRNIQMARAFDPRKIEMMDTLVTHLPWQFWLDAIPEKVILAWKRDKQKKEQAEEDKVEKPTLVKRISRRVSRIG